MKAGSIRRHILKMTWLVVYPFSGDFIDRRQRVHGIYSQYVVALDFTSIATS